MKFDKLKPGMIVYDVGREQLGNTKLRTVAVWQVRIIEVNEDDKTVIASWNSNPKKKYYERTFSKWRAKPPMLIDTMASGKRLATREEQKAAKLIKNNSEH